jgi:enolase
MIISIYAREVLDSRGNPTVEVDLKTEKGLFRAMVPSGASTGVHEAVELRDNDNNRYNGKGVIIAVENINKIIAPALQGKDETKQEELDKFMLYLDGTPNKSKIGANAILAVSIALTRAGAEAKAKPLYKYIAENLMKTNISLPIPSLNIINGGKHAGNKLQFQEFMILPIGIQSFAEAMRLSSETYHKLKSLIKSRYGKDAINVGDEGGFAPPLNSVEEALILLNDSINDLGYSGIIKIAIDAAASEFYKDGKYYVDEKYLTKEELLDYYVNLVDKYPIVSIEDPFEQEDFESFAKLRSRLHGKAQIVGDDLLVTNVNRIKTAINHGSCNTLLLKINQIGTITESIAAAKLARSNHWKIMVSHRSGETEDSFIADFAVGIGSEFIKSGATARSERLSKYNQLLRIEEQSKAPFGRK